MNVVLLYPEFPDTFWSLRHALRFIRRKASLPPLGLLTVASLLPADWGKRLVDTNVMPLTPDDLAWADYVFISAMIVQRNSARRAISRCKEAGVTVVAGGPLFITEHEEVGEVDHFVLNEAEITLPPFLADLERGQAERLYTTTELADVRQSPSPAWELADLRRYATMCVQFSRGCPFDCEFCNVTAMFGHGSRTKTVEQIIAELDGLYARGWRDSFFSSTTISSETSACSRASCCPPSSRGGRARRGFALPPRRASTWPTTRICCT